MFQQAELNLMRRPRGASNTWHSSRNQEKGRAGGPKIIGGGHPSHVSQTVPRPD